MRTVWHRRLDITVKKDDGALLAIAPEAECIAVRVHQVRKRLELAPLPFVVRISGLTRVRAFARRFDLDEPDERIVDRHCVVGACLDFAERGLADQMDGASRQATDFAELPNEAIERTSQLIFRRTADRGAAELRFDLFAEPGDRFGDRTRHRSILGGRFSESQPRRSWSIKPV